MPGAAPVRVASARACAAAPGPTRRRIAAGRVGAVDLQSGYHGLRGAMRGAAHGPCTTELGLFEVTLPYREEGNRERGRTKAGEGTGQVNSTERFWRMRAPITQVLRVAGRLTCPWACLMAMHDCSGSRRHARLA